MSNGGKFKLYTVLNGLLFPTPTQPRISFKRAIFKVFFHESRKDEVVLVITKEIQVHNVPSF
jgi:hypothetical protein